MRKTNQYTIVAEITLRDKADYDRLCQDLKRYFQEELAEYLGSELRYLSVGEEQDWDRNHGNDKSQETKAAG